jgi:cysteinyl-tRNA synthetase
MNLIESFKKLSIKKRTVLVLSLVCMPAYFNLRSAQNAEQVDVAKPNQAHQLSDKNDEDFECWKLHNPGKPESGWFSSSTRYIPLDTRPGAITCAETFPAH